MKPKILIVDDEPDILRTLELALKATDFNVKIAASGKEALALFLYETFDLVVTDIRMPETSGLDLMRQIKEMDEYTEIIILSGFATLENAIATLKEDGAFDYLTKPLDSIDKLIMSMRKALERRQLRLANATLVRQLTQAKQELETRVRNQTEAARALIKSEEALRESEDRFRALVEMAPDGILVFDPDFSSFIQANASICRMLDYDRETLLQKNWLDISADYQIDGRSTIEHGPELARKNLKQESLTTEWIFLRRDGKKMLAELRMSQLTSKSHPLVRASVVDITEKKNLESQIQHSRRMEAVGTLAGGIAHEFNNILGIVLGNAELALEDLPAWNPAHGCLKEICAASLRARDVVKGLLDFSHKTDAKRKYVKITPVIEDVLKLLRATLPSSITIAGDMRAPSVVVLADPHQLQQMVINLCTNAAHAMRLSGGTLTVGLTRHTPGDPVCALFNGLSAKACVALYIKDEGHGIDPEIRDRIFDPFFTTKDVGEGTGMGLAVVHGIVERHGGHVTVQSDPGQGATFTIFLPEVDADEMSSSKGSRKNKFTDCQRSGVRLARHEN